MGKNKGPEDLKDVLEDLLGEMLSIETLGNPGADEIGRLDYVGGDYIRIDDEGKPVWIAIRHIASFEPAPAEG